MLTQIDKDFSLSSMGNAIGILGLSHESWHSYSFKAPRVFNLHQVLRESNPYTLT